MVQRWSQYTARALRTVKKRGAVFVLVIASIFTMALLQPAPTTSAANTFDLAALGLGSNSCAVPTVGWVLCPTMRVIASMADGGFAFINNKTLALNFEIFNSSSSAFKAFDIVRLIANAVFAVVFLYIIYGYLIGKTGGSYTIKRLLPRLIITALLVQISFYIAVIAVDVSNIIGNSIWQIFSQIYGGTRYELGPDTDYALARATANVLGQPGTWVSLLPLVVVVDISIALITGVTVILIVMRETLVAALIIASPLLIVLYLLPNLERVSAQAGRLFLQLLVLYPIIALLLGTGQIVSAGIYNAQTGGTFNAGSANIFMSAAAAVLPLLGVWFVFKNTSSLMDMAGARLSASVAARRGGSYDKDARVTGKASAGVASMKNALGAASGLSPRKVSFGRNRRRSSIADSLLTANGIKTRSSNTGGLQQNTPNEFNTSSTLSNAYNSSEQGTSNSDTNNEAVTNEVSSLNQNITATNNDIQQGGTGDKILTAVLGAKGREKDNEKEKKSTTAKDIFSSLNRGMGHESKDKQRSFGAGPGPVGGTQASGQVQSGQQTAGPATSYRAPSMAQDANIISGGSISSVQTPVQTIAIPVAVDASALLNRNTSAPSLGNPMSPIVGTQKDAEARANKYIFESQRDINDARDAEDILGHKRNTLNEPSPLEDKKEKSLDQDENK